MLFYCCLLSVFLILIGFVCYKKGKFSDLHYSREPPQPFFAVPLLGHLPLLYNIQPHMAFWRLSKNYGPIFRLQLGSWRTLVINGPEAIKEALCRRFHAFSGRPPFPTWLAGSLGGRGIIAGSYCARWKQNKNAVLTTTREYVSNERHIDQIFEEECTRILKAFKTNENSSFDPEKILTLAVCNVMCDYIIGRRFQPTDEDFCALIQCTQDILTNKHPLEGLIDFLPWLGYFRSDMLNRTNNTTRRALTTLKKLLQRSCLVSDLNDNDSLTTLPDVSRVVNTEDQSISGETILILHNLFSAGCETTLTTLRWAVAFLINHPEHQNEAQRELDKVIGSSRLPNYNDKPHLPYTQAILLETLRLGNTAPLTIPHYTIEDTTLCGYEVKKDTLVFINLFSMHMDPEVWHEPKTFNPKRFLDDQDEMKSHVNLFPFSAGVRSCPGKMLAERELFLFLATILHQFELFSSTEEDIDINGLMRCSLFPKPYNICVSSRYL